MNNTLISQKIIYSQNNRNNTYTYKTRETFNNNTTNSNILAWSWNETNGNELKSKIDEYFKSDILNKENCIIYILVQ